MMKIEYKSDFKNMCEHCPYIDVIVDKMVGRGSKGENTLYVLARCKYRLICQHASEYSQKH